MNPQASANTPSFDAPGRSNGIRTRCTLLGSLIVLACMMMPAAGAHLRHSGPTVVIDGEGSGAGYQQVLIEAIRTADRIVVTEHSNIFDRHAGARYDGPYVVYRSHPLSDDERAALLRRLESIDPHATMDPMCLFSPHHAIELYAGERRDSTLEICFACGQLEWNAVSAYYPDELLVVFKELVVRSGMTPEQNWREKASEIERGSPRDEYLDPANKRWQFGAEW